MQNTNRTVHLFSFIAKTDVLLKKALPQINIKNITFEEDVTEIFTKKVTDAEIAQLKDAKILITDAFLLSQVYKHLPKLEWVQLTYAGVETLTSAIKPENKPDYPVCRNGAFGQQMKEYVITWIINHERSLLRVLQMKEEKGWYKADMVGFRTLNNLTVGVMGLGSIGSEIVVSLKALGCKVHGYGKSEKPTTDAPLDAYWNMNELDDLLENCDYLVNVLPSTDITKYLLGGDRLSPAKKKKPVFMNIGRGDIISEEDLVKALDKEWISHAIVDVFENEPLQQHSLYWNHPKITLTPHIAAFSTASDVVPVFIENLRRREANEPLLYPVDFNKAY